MRVTQAEAASNLYRVGISPLSQCEHPRPCSSVSQPGRARTGSFGPGSVHVSPFGPVHFGGSVGAGFVLVIPAPSHARRRAVSSGSSRRC